MDLTQRKLTKAEWSSIEIPCSDKEIKIIDLIKKGSQNVNVCKNDTQSLINYMKISPTEIIDVFIYTQYLQPELLLISNKYNLSIESINNLNKLMKKADIIRFSNTSKQLNDQKNNIFEFIVLNLLDNLYSIKIPNEKKSKKNIKRQNKSPINKWIFYYYTLKTLFSYTIENCNQIFKKNVLNLLNKLDEEVTPRMLVEEGYNLIERNEYILKYSDEILYEHQKKLFTICKNPSPKLILYIAPTGTGKTLSPIGLAETHRVIFVCAARHVGLALAKQAVSAKKRIAFAFGCSDTDDIRLHYSAAKDFTRNKKTGGICKVDNSVGDNVEIMICDIKSYLYAMYYMIAFNSKEKIIMFWDEPTISLDYPTHDLHDIIKNNWSNNLIPNVVLSCATLPHKEDLYDVISDFKGSFDNAECHEIISHDSKKTIPIINKNGYVEMPHYLYGENEYSKILEVVTHCTKNKTLLRYIDLNEAIKFIMFINADKSNQDTFIKSERYTLENNLSSFSCINITGIKEYYLYLLGNLKKDTWPIIHKTITGTRKKKMESTINISTTDAHTLTDGPTIFLAENIEKIAKFYIQSAQIPEGILKDIMGRIEINSSLNSKIRVLEKDLEDGTKKDENKEKKMSEGRIDPEMKKLMEKIEQMRANVKAVFLNPKYVPNTKEHIHKYVPNAESLHILNHDDDEDHTNNEKRRQFSCDISEYMVEQIMLVDDVNDMWKLLLLMGIGVFSTHKSDRYTEIMKNLAHEQKLYMIIASSDYIYGTNYQFCHGYIGKDLGNMSQEKCIQSMGRVGRNKMQQDYSIRFRDDELILNLFKKEENKPEIKNMNLLFTK